METSTRTLGLETHDRRLGFVTLAMLWAFVVLMIVPEGFNYQLVIKGNNPIAADLITRLLWLSLLGMSVVLVFWRAALSWRLLRTMNPYLIAAFVFVVLSMTWSLEPRLTLRRDVRLLTFILIALAFAVTAWHPRRFQQALRPILTTILAGSIVFGLLAPTLAIHQEASPELAGAWRGLTNHKNSLGALASLTFMLWLHAWAMREARAVRALLGCVLAGACIALSRSATSLIATVLAGAFLLVVMKWPRSLRPYLKYALALVPFALVIYVLILLRVLPGLHFVLSPVAAVTGGDITLTGRSDIWFIIREHILAHPIVGSGYGAYWVGPDPQSPSYAFITRMNGFYPGSSHNGYLEVANDLGFVGLALLFGYLLTHIRQCVAALSADRSQALLYLGIFMQQVVLNMSESHWFSALSVQFAIMTIATVALARLLVDQQVRIRLSLQRFAAAAPRAAAWQFTHRPQPHA